MGLRIRGKVHFFAGYTVNEVLRCTTYTRNQSFDKLVYSFALRYT
jgi:hypothetical protein